MQTYGKTLQKHKKEQYKQVGKPNDKARRRQKQRHKQNKWAEMGALGSVL